MDRLATAAPTQVVLATRNKGKIKELNALLMPLGVRVVGLDAFPDIGDIPETGETFLDNARIKAQAVCKATGLVSLADDSGLCVDALSGAPGVHSARFSGEHASDAANNAKLLAAMAHVPERDRTCRFVSVVVAACPDGRELTAEGTWEGRVLAAPAGNGGFGYDPLFFDSTAGKSSAELTPEEKNARSHRGKALAKLVAAWPGFWGEE
ncbi:non-canonical purine NTP pyrophosphatase, rdgB/HAM1 family [Solidesulfovibrio fructosivorans JJ]]|uniref:dITP/XTP pyrophosphatase n=1 Tax=Solidesulfovibrio fructosivorans JJ] TaxID=596151 RepID=E1JRX8_SOLFR|nr:XTP/dITP diphosphatase [Solidesulfovibrio fructosivorans]EFL52747.1 non-canonical purine NTP pyrophosphatase, rdgB/HAM1 family [Solidesulfovibrio fructosivorans JJ]]